MEEVIIPTSQLIEHCPVCNTAATENDVFCGTCGYPLKGTEQEQKDFMLKRDIAGIDMEHFSKQLKNAANSLYYLAGVFVVSGLIVYLIKKDDPDSFALLLENLILAFVFLALGGFARKKPLACIVSGLCLYVIVILLNAFVNPGTLFYGIIVKIAIIGYMIKGIKSAIEIEKIKKEHHIA